MEGRPTTALAESGRPVRVAIVGAGPRATSVLERLVANRTGDTDTPGLEIHVVDPWPAGGGRIWRQRQSTLLWSNTEADQCTIYPDQATRCDGPVSGGPTLAEWAADLSRGKLASPASFRPHDATVVEAAKVTGTWFASRSLLGDYLAWAFWRAVEQAAPAMPVHLHRARVLDVHDLPGGGQRLSLDDSSCLDVDIVLLAQGNVDHAPHPLERRLADYGAEHGLTYLPTASTADISLDSIKPGEPLIARGLGLAFVDIAVMLTSGRGGTFHRDGTGRLYYQASGREPVIFAGSRRGVPFQPKFRYQLAGAVPVLPRHFSLVAIAGLNGRPLDFRRDLWPVIARELVEAGYRELATAYPDRLTMDAAEFLHRLDALEGPGGPDAGDDGWNPFAELVGAAVSAEDRIDLDGLNHPLEGLCFSAPDALRDWMVDHIGTGLARACDRRHSAHLAVVHAIESVVQVLGEVLDREWLLPGPDLAAFLEFCRFSTSGPPAPRSEQLIALARAGVVRFLGAGTDVTATGGVFQARSRNLERVTEARAMIEARLPTRWFSRVTDPLLSRLRGRGEIVEAVVVDNQTGLRRPSGRMDVDPETHRLRRADDSYHPDRFWLGGVDLPRPGSNARFFRENDMVARSVLRRLRHHAAVAAAPVGVG